MQEIWKDIKGYEGLYQVSNYGNVRSLPRVVAQGKYGNTRTVGGYNLNQIDNGNGYLFVFLWQKSKRKNFYVHRLVATHFLDNPNEYKYVNHKDYNTYNNRAENLEWCTQRQNVLHSANRMRKPHKQWKRSATGEKHIYIRNGKYRLCIPKVIDKTYKTAEEAIQAREVILSGEKYFAG